MRNLIIGLLAFSFSLSTLRVVKFSAEFDSCLV